MTSFATARKRDTPLPERPERPQERGVVGQSGTFPVAERSLDDYDPETDVVPPISVRTSFMELLWVCGDCGEHYARARTVPEQCTSCGGPKQNFYAPTED